MTRPKRPTVGHFLAKFSLILGVFCLFAAAALGYLLSPPSASPVTFTIPPGSSVRAVANILVQQGLIRSPHLFRLYVSLWGVELQAGEYSLAPTPLPALASRLTRGYNRELKLTIPEGYRLEQIAESVEATLAIPQDEFLTAAEGFEGILFPETYFFTQGATSADVVDTMRRLFITKFGELDQQTVILASLVERESQAQAEKPIVAGILLKRLSHGWPLELDATVQYALGHQLDWWPDTTLADREVQSPYNTYLHPGLPPGPICAPGADSLTAVLNPSASDYWFYLHEPSGQIRYAVTAQEHAANIERYLR